jgi:hypothetical protein
MWFIAVWHGCSASEPWLLALLSCAFDACRMLTVHSCLLLLLLLYLQKPWHGPEGLSHDYALRKLAQVSAVSSSSSSSTSISRTEHV